MPDFKQLDEDRRNASMRPIATLALEPEDFRERFKLEFTKGPSNLGDSCAALVQMTSGRQFMLMRYFEAPEPGVELLADEDSDPSEDLSRFLDAFQIDDTAVTWALQAAHPVAASPQED